MGLESSSNDRAGEEIGGEGQSSMLEMLSLRSSLALQMEVFSRQFDLQDRGLEKRCKFGSQWHIHRI